jgi:photosystem II stability/assembly factor-like uncharacterized protein
MKPVLYILVSNPDYSQQDKDTIKTIVSNYIAGLSSADNLPFKLIQDTGAYLEIHALIKVNDTIFAGTYGGVYLSVDEGATWNPAGDGITFPEVRAFASNDTSIFAGTNGGGVFRSDDNGESWTDVNSEELKSSTVNSITIKDANVFLGTNNGVFISGDNGSTWTNSSSGIPYIEPIIPVIILPDPIPDDPDTSGNPPPEIESVPPPLCYDSISSIIPMVVFLGGGLGGGLIGGGGIRRGINSIFAGTNNDGIFRSDDDGATWNQKNTGITDLIITSLAVNGSTVYAGTNSGGIFVSDDIGENWTNVGLSGNCINALYADDNGIVAGTDNGVFISTDGGTTWADINSGLAVTRIYALLQDDVNLFIGTYYGGVFLTSDSGATWTEMNSGIHPYLGSILLPVETTVPDFISSIAAYDTSPVINPKTGQIIRPSIDINAMAQREQDLLAYDGTGSFPEVIMLQLTGHVTGEVKE